MTDGTGAITDWAGQRVLAPDECYELLGATPVGRIGFLDAGSPVVLPVNFALDGRAVVFRSGPGSKLSAAILGQPVCFEVDAFDSFEHTGWSVVVKGVANSVNDSAEIERLEALPVQPWFHPEERTNWVRIRPDEVTGRGF
jgi:hypothetical protein